jgi:hypothetical protein
LGSSLSHWEHRGSMRMATSFRGIANTSQIVCCIFRGPR